MFKPLTVGLSIGVLALGSALTMGSLAANPLHHHVAEASSWSPDAPRITPYHLHKTAAQYEARIAKNIRAIHRFQRTIYSDHLTILSLRREIRALRGAG